MVRALLGVTAVLIMISSGEAVADEQLIELSVSDAPGRYAPYSWVPEDRDLHFGEVPLEHVRAAAGDAADSAGCSVTRKAATAMVLAMTWPEVAPSGAAPSPMTLSRWDNQPTLGDPRGRAPGLWFHPGIGMWQLDSAGLGTGLTAAEAMDTELVAERIAPYIATRYCAERNDGASPADARSYAWRAWHACRSGACEDAYRRALNGVIAVDDVGRLGGAEERRCWFRGAAHDCTYVDPSAATGSTWWTRESAGRSPVTAPFYSLKLDGEPETELRYWLASDSRAKSDVTARRRFGTDAREGLRWATGSGLCDLTEQRGDC